MASAAVFTTAFLFSKMLAGTKNSQNLWYQRNADFERRTAYSHTLLIEQSKDVSSLHRCYHFLHGGVYHRAAIIPITGITTYGNLWRRRRYLQKT